MLRREEIYRLVVVACVAFALGSFLASLNSTDNLPLIHQPAAAGRGRHTSPPTAAYQYPYLVQPHGAKKLPTHDLTEQRDTCLREKRAVRAAYGVLYCRQQLEQQGNTEKTVFGPTGGWCMDLDQGLDHFVQARQPLTDLALADAVAELVQRDRSTTLYDLGGNVGLYSRRFRERGLNATCFDGSEGIEVVTQGQVRFLDLAEPFDDIGPAEWVMSLEVGEHLPKQFQDQFMRNLVLHSKRGIILSWAKPGQGGRGHFNELPACAVVAAMAAQQRAVDPSHHVVWDHEATAWLSDQAQFPWLKDNLLVFRKREGPETEATRPLPCP